MSASADSFELVEPVLCELVVESFTGETDLGENYHGKGEIKMRNGCTYKGLFKGGLFHGTGRLSWPDGVIYEGAFNLGVIDGQGSFKWPDGSTYKGAVCAGKRSGFGLFKCSAGQIYEGDWLDGVRHGKGTASYREQQSTTVYTGDWNRGLRQGYGLMKYASGNTYEGYWHADKKQGMGLMIWHDKDNMYAGEWKEDLPHGQGENLWANVSLSKLMTKQISSIYRGEWDMGRKHGHGSFFYSDGSQYAGQWANGDKNGDGVILYGDGRVNPAKFRKGQNMLQAEVAPPIPVARTNSQKGSRPNSQMGTAAPSPSTRADDSAADEIRLHIRDLLQILPRADGKKNPATEPVSTSRVFVDGGSDATLDARELERLLLRFNTSLKQIYARLVESVQKDHNKLNLSDTLVKADFAVIDKAIATALVNHQKFFCMTLREMKAYCRELGLLGPNFTSQQVTQALLNALEEQKMQADYAFVTQKLTADQKASLAQVVVSPGASKVATPPASAHASRPVSAKPVTKTHVDLSRSGADILADIEITAPAVQDLHSQTIGPTAVTRDITDVDQPICEQTFFNVLVRCLALSDVTASPTDVVYNPAAPTPTDSMDGAEEAPRMPLVLSHALLMGIQHVNAQYETKPAKPLFLSALTAESTNELLQNNRQKVDSWWGKCLAQAEADGVSESKQGNAQLRHVVRVLLKLKGVAIRERTTTMDLLKVLHAPFTEGESSVPAARPQTAAPPPSAEVPTDADAAAAATTVAETAAEPVAEEAPVDPATDEDAGAGAAPVPEGRPNASRPHSGRKRSLDAPFDLSCLTLLVDKDDFIEKVCRLVLSDAWCYIDPSIAAAKAAAEEAAVAAAAAAAAAAESAVAEGEGEAETKGEPAAVVVAEEEEVVVEVEVAEADLPIDQALQKRLNILFVNFEALTT